MRKANWFGKQTIFNIVRFTQINPGLYSVTKIHLLKFL